LFKVHGEEIDPLDGKMFGNMLLLELDGELNQFYFLLKNNNVHTPRRMKSAPVPNTTASKEVRISADADP
jgi:hypothetical protein